MRYRIITLLMSLILIILCIKSKAQIKSFGTGLDGIKSITSTEYIDQDRAQVSSIDAGAMRIYLNNTYKYGKFTMATPFTYWTLLATQWDMFLLIQMEGGNIGTYTLVAITNWNQGTPILMLRITTTYQVSIVVEVLSSKLLEYHSILLLILPKMVRQHAIHMTGIQVAY